MSVCGSVAYGLCLKTAKFEDECFDCSTELSRQMQMSLIGRTNIKKKMSKELREGGN